MSKKITCGILAHVDAGKTTLSESLLYNCGYLKNPGRVDHGDAFLDTDSMEKKRGITIYSKPAIFSYEDLQINLVDTPGHVDFVTETERSLWVLDVAILVISGPSMVQSHTKTLFRLLNEYRIPTIIFINKMDQYDGKVEKVLANIKAELSLNAGLYTDLEAIAENDELALEEYLETGLLSDKTKGRLFFERKWFPVFEGSALNNVGIKPLLEGLYELSNFKNIKDFSSNRENKSNKENKSNNEPLNKEGIGLKVYKVESLGRDARLSFCKITSGSLKVKDILSNGEKVDQIRVYSGIKYTQVNEASEGDIVALVGPKMTFPGNGLGTETDNRDLFVTPVLEYSLSFLDNTNPKLAYESIKRLSEEDPSLHVYWDEKCEEIKLRLMGQVQTEIITSRIKDELGLEVEFVNGNVLYKETITDKVEGVGHFEPLRHYAEVHLLMEPLEEGEGIEVVCDCSTDDLALNWQRLIATHILEKEHLGVLTGSPLTDVKITIIGGRAHIKHTEGGDFREATYRAIRQGLMEANSTLLEPYYNFEIRVPGANIGRVLNDIEKMSGSFDSPMEEGESAIIKGQAPATLIQNYQEKLISFTKGLGSIVLSFGGYKACHNSEEVIAKIGYNPLLDVENSCDSVFCSHGSAIIVPFDEVKSICHVPCKNMNTDTYVDETPVNLKRQNHSVDEWLDPEEIDAILYSATHKNVGKNSKKNWNYSGNQRIRRSDNDYEYKPAKTITAKEKYLLVDGYNLIYAWPKLKSVLDENLDGARGMLLDILSNYKAMTDYNIIAVFDAYRVKGHKVETLDYQNIHQVFTAEAQTADAYIEKFSHSNNKKYDITVVTSDGLEQVIIRGAGANLLSSRDFIKEVEQKAFELRERYQFEAVDE